MEPHRTKPTHFGNRRRQTFLFQSISPTHLHYYYCLFCFHFCFLPHKRQTDSRDASICHLRPTKRHTCGRQQWGPPIPGYPLWGWSRTKGSDPRGTPALCPSPSATPETRYVGRVHFSSSVLCQAEKIWFSPLAGTVAQGCQSHMVGVPRLRPAVL